MRAIGGLCKLFVLRGERDAAASGSTARTTTSAFASWTSTTKPTGGTSSVAGSISRTAGRSSLNRSSPGPISWYAGARPGWNTSKCSTHWPALASDSPATATRPGYGPPRIRFSAPVRDPGNLLGPPAEDETAAAHPRVPGTHPLTQREATVLAVLATGATNAEIAEALYLSERTVEAHLRSIYHKIGVRSRSAATRYALDNDLT